MPNSQSGSGTQRIAPSTTYTVEGSPDQYRYVLRGADLVLIDQNNQEQVFLFVGNIMSLDGNVNMVFGDGQTLDSQALFTRSEMEDMEQLDQESTEWEVQTGEDSPSDSEDDEGNSTDGEGLLPPAAQDEEPPAQANAPEDPTDAILELQRSLINEMSERGDEGEDLPDDVGAGASSSPDANDTTEEPEAPKEEDPTEDVDPGGNTLGTSPTITLTAASDSGTEGDFITNDQNPAFEGTALEGSTVTIYVDDLEIESIPVGEDGTFVSSGTYNINDGNHTLYAISTLDGAEATSNVHGLSIDITAPDLPSLEMSLPQGTGSIQGGTTYTSDSTPTLLGTGGDPDSTVTLSYSADGTNYTELGTVDVGPDGSWSYTLQNEQALGDGDYTFRVSSTDLAANLAQGFTFLNNVVIKTDNPESTLSLSAASDSMDADAGGTVGDRLTNAETLELNIDASSDTAQIEVFRVGDGEYISLGQAEKIGGNWVFTVAHDVIPDDGTYKFVAQATDVAGNVEVIQTKFGLEVEIDRTPEPVNPILDLNTASDSADSLDLLGTHEDDYTNADSLTLDGHAGPNVPIDLYLSVDGGDDVLISDGEIVTDAFGNWSYIYDSSGYGQSGIQELTFTAQVLDAAGNINETEMTVTVDHTDPDIPSIGLANLLGTLESDILQDVATVRNTDAVLEGVVTEGSDDIVLTIYQVNDDGSRTRIADNMADNGALGDVTVTDNGDGTYSWSYDYGAIADGQSYTFVATAEDQAGNFSIRDSKVLIINADTTISAPAIELDPDTDTAGGPSGTVGDDYTGYVDGDKDNPLQLTVSGDDNTTISVYLVDPAAPGAQAIISNGVTVGIGILVDMVEQDAGDNWPKISFDASGYENTETNLTFIAVSEDKAGNNQYTEYSLTLDDVDPSGGGIDLDTPDDFGVSDTDNITNAKEIQLGGTLTEGDSAVKVTVFDNGVELGEATITSDGSGGFEWSYTIGDENSADAADYIATGNHSYTAVVEDNAGNTLNLDALPVVVDRDITAPTFDLTSGIGSSDTGRVTDDHITNATDLVFEGSSDVGDTVTVHRVIGGVDTIIDSFEASTADWTYTVDNADAPSDGTYSFYVTTNDVAGNTSSTAPVDVLVDRSTNAPGSLDLTAESDSSYVDGAFTADTTDSDDITNKDTLVITGQVDADHTEPLSVVTLYIQGVADPVGSVTLAEGDTTWSISVPNGAIPIDGDYDFYVRYVDLAGNESDPSADLTVSIDRTAPVDPVITLDGADGTDYYVHGGTVYTNDIGPTFTLSNLEAGTILNIKIDGVSVATPDGVDGSLTFDPADFASNGSDDGTHTVSVVAVDEAGNASGEVEYSFVLDTAAESLADIRLTDESNSGDPGDTITFDTTPTIQGSAEANSEVTVTLRDEGGNAIATETVTADASGDWTSNFTDDSVFVDGTTYTVDVSATDYAGNVATDNSYTFTLDTSIDAVDFSMVENATNDTGIADDDQITSNQNPEFTWTAHENLTATISIYTDGGALVEAYTVDSPSGVQTWAVPVGDELANGTYTVRATFVDVAGNTVLTDGSGNPVTEEVTVTIDRDITAPTFDLTSGIGSSDTGRVTDDHITNATDLVFEGSSDVGDTVTVHRVIGGVDTIIDSFEASTADWTYTVDNADAPSDGTYSFYVTTNDVAGNTSSTAPVDVLVDRSTNAPGSLDLTAESDSSYVDGAFTADTTDSDDITNKDTLVITGQVDADHTEPLSVVTLYIQGVADPVGSVTLAEGDTTWSISVPNGAIPIDGDYDFYVRYVDLAGNESDPSADLTVSIDRTAPVDPVITLDGADGTDYYVHGGTVYTNDIGPTFTLSNLEAGTVLNIKIDGVSVATPDGVDGSLTFDPADFASNGSDDGTHTVSVVAVDEAGNASGEVEYSFVLDTAAESLADIRLTDESNSGDPDDTITFDTTPTIQGSAEANSEVTVTLRDEGGNAIATETVTADASGDWTSNFTDDSVFVDGTTYTVDVSATDYAGNVATDDSYTFTLDTSIDAVDFSMVENATNDTGIADDDQITSNQNPEFTWTAHENLTATISIYTDGGALVEAYTVDSPSGVQTWAVPVGDELANGTYTVRATFVDVAGNTVLTDGSGNPVTEEVTVTIDRDITAPTFDLTSGIGSSDTGRVTDDHITNATDLVFEGSSDVGDTVTVRRIIDGVDTIIDSFEATTADWTYTVDNADVPSDGTYSFYVTTIDAAGNADASTPVDVLVDRSTNAPGSLDLTAESDSSYVDGAFTADTTDSDDITNKDTLVITGQVDADHTEPLSVVTLYIQGVADPVGSVTLAEGDTTWSISVPNGAIPIDGDYDFYVRYVDLAGNESDPSADLTVSIDRAAPLDPVITLDGNVGTDYFIHGDTIYTNDPGPTFTLSGLEVGTFLNIKIDGVSVATPECMAGTLAFDPTDFAGDGSDDGTHTVSVVAVDEAGNASNEVEFSFVLDAAADSISDVRLADESNTGVPDDTITFDTTPTIQGSAEANSEVTVTLRDEGGNAIATETVTADASGDWTSNFTDDSVFVDGTTYTVDVSATDYAGNVATDNSYTFTLDTSIDAVDFSMVETSANDTGFELNDQNTRNQNPEFTWTAHEDLTATISIYNEGGTLVKAYTVDSPSGVQTWAVPGGHPLLDGTYTVLATFTDVAGNTVLTDGSGNPVTEEVTVTVDTIAPPLTVELADASDSGIDNDWLTNDTKVAAGLELTGAAEAGSRLYVYVNDMVNPVSCNGEDYLTVDASGNWTFDLSALDLGSGINSGDNSIMVVAEDRAGNTSTFTHTLEVDTDVVPVGNIFLDDSSDSGFKGDFITNDMTPTITGTTERNATVEISIDGGATLGTVTADVNGAWSWTVPDGILTLDGDYEFTATITDDAGNVATTGRVITIDTDLLVPTVSMTVDSYGEFFGSDSDFITQDTTPTFTVTTEANTTLEVYLDGALVHTIDESSNTNGVLTYNQAELTEGSHTFVFKSLDNAGNTSELTQVVEIDSQYDAGDLSVALNSNYDTGISDSDGLTSQTRPVFSGTAEAGSKVRVYFSERYASEEEANLAVTGDDYTVEMTLAGTQTLWEYTSSNLMTDGFYKITVVSEDEAGNQQTKISVMELDTTPPEVPTFELTTAGGNTIENATLTTDNTPGFAGTAEAGSTVTISVNQFGSAEGVLVFNATADASGNWFYQVKNTESLMDGSYNVSVTSTDDAGNTAEGTAEFMISGETPVAPTIALAAADDSNIDTDGITNINTGLTLTGVAQSHCDVQIYVTNEADTDRSNGVLVTTVEAGGNGVWTADLSGTFPDNSYYYYAKSEYSVGNVYTSDLYTLEVDTHTVDPTIELADDTGVADEWVAPAANTSDEDWESSDATITGVVDEGSTVVITATNTTTSAVTTVTIDPENLTKVGDVWTYNHDLSALGDGEFNVQVTSTDVAGNQGTSIEQTITFDSQTSKPTIELPVASETELSVGAGGEILLANGNPAGPALESHLPAGFVSTLSDGYTQNNTLPLSGQAEPGSMVRITILKDGEAYPSPAIFVSPDGTGEWTYDTGELPDGLYTFEVTSIDIAGNESTADPLNVYVDAVATRGPAIAIHDDIPGNDTPDTTPTVTLYGDSDSTYLLYLDDQTEPVATGTFNVSSYAQITPGVTAGIDALTANVDHTYTLVTVDRAGNVQVSNPFHFEIDTIAPELQDDPISATGTSTVILDAEGNPAQIYTNDNDPTLTVRVEAGTQARLIGFGDDEWVTDEDGDGLITFQQSANSIVDEGSHSVTLMLRDAAQNHDAANDLTFNLVVDTNRPATEIELSQTSDLGFSNSDGITSGDQLTLMGTIIETGLGQSDGDFTTDIADYSVEVTNQTTGVSETIDSDHITLNGDGTWQLTYGEENTPLIDGNYSAELTATDMAGNEHSSSIDFTVDNDSLNVLQTPDLTLQALGNTGYSIIKQEDYLPDTVDPTHYKYEMVFYGKDGDGNDISLSLGESSFDGNGGIEELVTPSHASTYDYVGIKVIDYAGNESDPTFTDLDATDVMFRDTTEALASVTSVDVSITGDTDGDGAQDDVSLAATAVVDVNGDWSWDFTGELSAGDYTVHLDFNGLDGSGDPVTSGIESSYDFSVLNNMLSGEMDLQSDQQDFSTGEADMTDTPVDAGGGDTVEMETTVTVDYVEGSIS